MIPVFWYLFHFHGPYSVPISYCWEFIPNFEQHRTDEVHSVSQSKSIARNASAS